MKIIQSINSEISAQTNHKPTVSYNTLSVICHTASSSNQTSSIPNNYTQKRNNCSTDINSFVFISSKHAKNRFYHTEPKP